MDKRIPPDRKTVIASAVSQLPRLMPLLLLIYLPILFGLLAIVVIYLKADIPPRIFFIDTVAEFNAPMYVGLVSNFGVLLWCAAASVCLFGGVLFMRACENRKTMLFLISAGLLSSLLMLDDLYLLHEEVLPDHLYVPQKLVFVIYGVLVMAFLIRFRQVILNTDFMLLLLAFGFFAASVTVDLFVEPEDFFIFGNFPGRHIVEDGFKLFGITAWTAYLITTCWQKVTPLVRPA